VRRSTFVCAHAPSGHSGSAFGGEVARTRQVGRQRVRKMAESGGLYISTWLMLLISLGFSFIGLMLCSSIETGPHTPLLYTGYAVGFIGLLGLAVTLVNPFSTRKTPRTGTSEQPVKSQVVQENSVATSFTPTKKPGLLNYVVAGILIALISLGYVYRYRMIREAEAEFEVAVQDRMEALRDLHRREGEMTAKRFPQWASRSQSELRPGDSEQALRRQAERDVRNQRRRQ
jgi:hypothetical protein